MARTKRKTKDVLKKFVEPGKQGLGTSILKPKLFPPMEEYKDVERRTSDNKPLFIPQPTDIVSKTGVMNPKLTFDKGGNVLEELPDGSSKKYTAQEWGKERDRRMGRSGSFGQLDKNQLVMDEISRRAGIMAADMRARGETGPVDYEQIYKDIIKSEDWDKFLADFPQMAEESANQPIDPFQPEEQTDVKKAIFGATGAATGGGLAAVGATVFGATPPGWAAGIAVAAGYIKGKMSAGYNLRARNIASATGQANEAAANILSYTKYAKARHPNREELLHGYDQFWRDIYASEAYLMELKDKSIVTKVPPELEAQLQKIAAMRDTEQRDREMFMTYLLREGEPDYSLIDDLNTELGLQ